MKNILLTSMLLVLSVILVSNLYSGLINSTEYNYITAHYHDTEYVDTYESSMISYPELEVSEIHYIYSTLYTWSDGSLASTTWEYTDVYRKDSQGNWYYSHSEYPEGPHA